MSSKYIVVNRESDFNKGLLVNMKIENQALIMSDESGIAKSSYYMAALDSDEREFYWGRFIVDISGFEGFIVISAFADDCDIMTNSNLTIDEYIKDKSIKQEEKITELDKLYTKVFSDAKDVVMDIKGRYLFVKIDIVLTSGKGPVLSAIKAAYKGDHMFDYLPDYYKKSDDGFLFRFLSIFDSFVFDLEDKINEISDVFDFEKQKGEMLRFLTSWVSVDGTYMNDEQLRKAVDKAVRDYEFSHTTHGIKKLIKSMVGVEPVIIEHFQLKEMKEQGKDIEVYNHLFNGDANTFYILLPQSKFKDEKEIKSFMDSLEKNIPANVCPELVLLKDGTNLDSYTFLGLNTALEGYSDVVINQSVAIENDIVIGGNMDEEQ